MTGVNYEMLAQRLVERQNHATTKWTFLKASMPD
jgi:hypothetical protein